MHLGVLETIIQGNTVIPSGFVLTFDSWNTHRDCRRDGEGNLNQTRVLNAYFSAKQNLESENSIPVEFHYELDLNTDAPKTESELYEFIQTKETVEIVE